MTRRRADFGTVRRLSSGRWQARYYDDDEVRHTAPATFITKTDARLWLASIQTDMSRDVWINPDDGTALLSDYAASWVETRLTKRGTPLRLRTRALYESLLRLHINPTFGAVALSGIKTPAVRRWYSALAGVDGPGETTAAKCYRLLRAVLATAVVDGMILKNPCIIEGAGVERAPERPLATTEQVVALVEALQPRYRIMALLGAYLGLRRGEILGLTRADVDLLHGTVAVARQRQYLKGHLIDDPKTDAGKRKLIIPSPLVPHLKLHLAHYAAPGVNGALMIGEKGGRLQICVWSKHWQAARTVVGVAELHLHDLRHFANTAVARSGVTTKELMAFMGHDSAAAALRYQHATVEGAHHIADAMGRLMEASWASPRGTNVTPLRAREGHAEGTAGSAGGPETEI